jgi:hypothetical protein
MIKFLPFLYVFLLFACESKVESIKSDLSIEKNSDLELNDTIALNLSKLPLKCLQQEYPNKLGQVLNSEEELKSPKLLHPTFYGCFDWHSSVHGHWLLVKLLKEFPELENTNQIRSMLDEQLTENKIQLEILFFKTKYNESFERTYGWAWLLKLQDELDTWNDTDAKKWSAALQPLTDLIVEKYMAFLPKLVYPIRTGEHINTAFGLSFAHDYAINSKNLLFAKLIEKRAKEFYLKDEDYPLIYEPSGYDFISPALAEADLMRRILSKSEFIEWLDKFLPEFQNRQFKLPVGKVSDRTDGKLVHLDGLNFSRAWCLYGIADVDPKFSHLNTIADQHLSHSLPSITDGDYMGEHWLASFALYALFERK